jgi:5-methyltetrahydropteroyltriglutamate--homocysteine methyltransferase
VLGLISTKRAELEPAGAIVKLIEEASRYFPRERMGLSTQCGFGTVWEGNPIPESTQRDKLRLVAEIAHRAWR